MTSEYDNSYAYRRILSRLAIVQLVYQFDVLTLGFGINNPYLNFKNIDEIQDDIFRNKRSSSSMEDDDGSFAYQTVVDELPNSAIEQYLSAVDPNGKKIHVNLQKLVSDVLIFFRYIFKYSDVIESREDISSSATVTTHEDKSGDNTQKSTSKIDEKYVNDSFFSLVDCLPKIDRIINHHLNGNWTIAKLDFVIRAILRAGTYELLSNLITDSPVITSEYTNIASCFFQGKEIGFVNGVLDKISKVDRVALINHGTPIADQKKKHSLSKLLDLVNENLPEKAEGDTKTMKIEISAEDNSVPFNVDTSFKEKFFV